MKMGWFFWVNKIKEKLTYIFIVMKGIDALEQWKIFVKELAQ